ARRERPFAIPGDGAAADFEIPRGQSPRPPRPVKACPADAFAPRKRAVPAHRPSRLVGAVAAGDRAAGEVLEQFEMAVVFELIVHLGKLELFLTALTATLQPDHLEPGLGQLLGQYAAGPADADGDDIYGFQLDRHAFLPRGRSIPVG